MEKWRCTMLFTVCVKWLINKKLYLIYDRLLFYLWTVATTIFYANRYTKQGKNLVTL